MLVCTKIQFFIKFLFIVPLQTLFRNYFPKIKQLLTHHNAKVIFQATWYLILRRAHHFLLSKKTSHPNGLPETDIGNMTHIIHVRRFNFCTCKIFLKQLKKVKVLLKYCNDYNVIQIQHPSPNVTVTSLVITSARKLPQKCF